MRFFKDLKAFRKLLKLPSSHRQIVFYSEGTPYWAHFRSIIYYLAVTLGQQITYVTSDPKDPGYTDLIPNVEGICIGEGLFRNMWFQLLKAKILVLTVPDLGNSELKRSKFSVHYVYMFHSIVSTHMIYNKGAFDNYDTIFCAGPHHVAEIRETERLYNLPPKLLIEHGYGRLDEIISEQPTKVKPHIPKETVSKKILIAPTWGPQGLIETGKACGLIDNLLNEGFEVILRPHPETLRRAGSCFDNTITLFGKHPAFTEERDVTSTKSLMQADLMLSDWSGAAIEYALGHSKPVLFVDTERKVKNADYENYESLPLEDIIRSTIGAILPQDRFCEVAQVARELIAKNKSVGYTHSPETYVYNVGNSAKIAAEWLLKNISEINVE